MPTAEAPPPAALWRALPRALFTGGNEVRLLHGGDDMFPAMCEAIARAHHDVWLATYIFHDDDCGQQVMDALIAAARRGVRVRVVVDGFGSKATLGELRERLEPAGVALAAFRPIGRWWDWMQPGQMRRLHQKLCVVDGLDAFVGGINIINDRYDLRHGLGDAPRLDFAVHVRGIVARPIEHAARAAWTRAWFGRDFREEIVAPARSAEPIARLRSLLRRMRMPGRRDLRIGFADLPPVQVAFVVRDNLRQRRTIERSYIDAIRGARDHVDLMSPYFYPGHKFRHALRHAAKRGVKVRLLLQGKLDYRIAGLAARVLYDELLASGVRVFEYTPAFLHAKVAAVDDDWATVGSSNIDPLSLLLNLEANVIVRDADFNAAVSRHFEDAIALSREVGNEQLRGNNFGWFLIRGFVAWCAHVYLRIGGATGRY